jgi:porin
MISFMVASGRTNPRLTRYQRDRTSWHQAASASRLARACRNRLRREDHPLLTLRPNLQYLMHPGGTGDMPDAFVIGLYTQVTF